MAWYTYHETATGKLLSIASESVTPPVGVTRIEYPTRPDLHANEWDEATATFVPRPPTVWVDRSDDVINDPRLSSINTGIKNQVRRVIDDVFGIERWRKGHHPSFIGGTPGNSTPPED